MANGESLQVILVNPVGSHNIPIINKRMEVGKTIEVLEKYPNYGVDKAGNVFSFYSNKRLKPIVDKYGYLIVTVYNKGTRKNVKIHRLVAETFLNNPFHKPHVNHKDGDKQNNSVDNLEWCTAIENTQHAIKTKLRNNSRPIRQLDCFGNIVKEYESISDAEMKTGIKRQWIGYVCKYQRYRAGGYKWEYCETSND